MNDRERDAYKPLCCRCGQPIVDIDWFDATRLDGPREYAIGRMRCSTQGCYDTTGSRDTSPLEPGGLTLKDHAWLRTFGATGHADT